jgi:hypothetical protein
MLTENVPKCSDFFTCEICDYKSIRKSQYNRHILSAKHKMLTNSPNLEIKCSENMFQCNCGKLYRHRQSLSVHKKKCNYTELQTENIDLNSLVTTDTVMNLVTENNDIKKLLCEQQKQLLDQQTLLMEQQKQLGELIPRVGNTINNTSNYNNINNNLQQNFNINIFLNEQCKNALNMNEFITQIKLSLQDLDLTKNKGLEISLSNAIIENMNKLSLFERPLHCTDSKRETLYIKDNDSWEKDNDKTKIREALKNLNKAHFRLIQEWISENPDFKEVDAKQDYFAYLLKTCSINLNSIDSKIIKKICQSNNLKDNLKEL